MDGTQLDRDACIRALDARDPRFDGRIFVGVHTTRIYCRPVCPAPRPKRENITFYPSAAAAAEAGLRPCLRCRPETAPGSPAWLGSRGTVTRALGLLDACLDDGLGAEDLARRLDLGRRQLDRLFRRHLGAPVSAVLRTRRLHRAKTLLDQTDLPITEVAWAAGFASLRRFNEAIRGAWKLSPSELRRRSRQRRRSPDEATLGLDLHYRPPLAWQALLEFLAVRATPGVERVEDGVYRRTFAFEEPRAGGLVAGVIAVRQIGERLRLEVPASAAPVLPRIIARVRRVFDLDAEPSAIAADLAADPLLAAQLAAEPGLRIPGAFDGFEVAVRAVLGQQISVKGATTLAGRVVERTGGTISGAAEAGWPWRLFPTPAALRGASLDGLGLIGSRIATLHALAAAVDDGRLSLAPGDAPETLRAGLVALPGIGEWTAQYVAMRLGDPDAFPASDLGLLRAVDPARQIGPKELERRAEGWRPWRAYAALHLWRLDARTVSPGAGAAKARPVPAPRAEQEVAYGPA